MTLTKGQAEVHVILTNMKMKVLVTKAILVAFFVVLIFLILLITCIRSDWQDKAIVGALDGVLGYTMYPLVTHYLPPKKRTLEAEARENENA